MRVRTAKTFLTTLFCIQAGNRDLLRAQYEAFQKQMPLMYMILAFNTAAVAYSFRNSAPALLAIWTPIGLCSLCIVRLAVWLLRRNRKVSDAQILRQLRITNKLSVIISIAFTGWSLSLYPYGDAYMKGHVAFYMALTEIAIIFCLMHLRSAALITTIVVLFPFCGFFFFVGIPSFTAIAVNLVLVCAAMITILFIYYRDFANLVESRKSLLAKHAETQRLSDENFRIANLDSLTDLPNRRSFFADLASCEAEARERGGDFAIGIIDLDGFKPVNDTYGHSTGDAMLIEAGNRMRAFVTEGISFARLGGDEFAVLVRGPASDATLVELGNKLCEAIRLPYQVGAATIFVSSSIGFAKYSAAYPSLEMVYERADYALYCAKRGAKGTALLFTDQHESQIQDSRVIEHALKTANLEAELFLMFQPIISTCDGRPMGFEALARWNSPSLGFISPMHFIPTAERVGIIGQITRILLKKAIIAAAEWPEGIRLSFNLSVHDICSAESVLGIIAIVNQGEIDPRRIDFEVTETAVAYDFSQALQAVVALRALGCGVSLDDFGTGFSSLSHLHRLPLDKVKVDKSFVEEITSNPVSFKIVKSLMALCADMGLKCVIEGVETIEQQTLLLKMGCDFIQGYYYSKPLSTESAKAFINEKRAPFRRSVSRPRLARIPPPPAKSGDRDKSGCLEAGP